VRSPPQPLTDSDEEGWDPTTGYEESPESCPTRIASGTRQSRDYGDAEEYVQTHSCAKAVETPQEEVFEEVEEDARTLFAARDRVNVSVDVNLEDAATNAVRRSLSRPLEDSRQARPLEDSRQARPLEDSRQAQRSYAALSVLPMVIEENGTELSSSSPSLPRSLPRASRPAIEWPAADDHADAMFENPTTPLPPKLSQPARRSRASCVSLDERAPFAPAQATSLEGHREEPRRPKLDLTLRARNNAPGARPFAGPRLPTEPIVGHPIMAETARTPAPTPPTSVAVPDPRRTHATFNAPPSAAPSFRRREPSRPPAQWTRGPTQSEPWNESPWVVSSASSSHQVRPVESSSFKLELPMIGAIATGAFAFCLIVGAFLYLRSDDKPSFDADARSASFAAEARSDSPAVPSGAPIPQMAPQPAFLPSVPTPAGSDSTHRAKRVRSESKNDTAKSDTTASSAPSAKPSKKAQPGEKSSDGKSDKGKSLEQILDELGEEQLRR
jgi:hypothetical protein